MDTLRWIFFESPLALALLAGFVNFWLLVHWRRSGKPRPLLVGLGVTVVLFIVQAWVETPREAVRRIVGELERAVEHRQIEPFERYLAGSFVAGSLGRETFIETVRAVLPELDVFVLLRQKLDVVAVDRGQVVATVYYVGNARYGDQGGAFKAWFDFRFGQIDGRWRIVAIDRFAVNDQPGRWERLSRRAGP